MILTIRTDKPEAEVNLYTGEGKILNQITWLAHRQLSTTLLSVIRDQLLALGCSFKDIQGVVVFRGPGSFTGLRIGITVANTFAYGFALPIIGSDGEDWQMKGIMRLKVHENDQLVLPLYGADAHITPPRK